MEQLINQVSNQSILQSINQSIDQSINQSLEDPPNPRIQIRRSITLVDFLQTIWPISLQTDASPRVSLHGMLVTWLNGHCHLVVLIGQRIPSNTHNKHRKKQMNKETRDQTNRFPSTPPHPTPAISTLTPPHPTPTNSSPPIGTASMKSSTDPVNSLLERLERRQHIWTWRASVWPGNDFRFTKSKKKIPRYFDVVLSYPNFVVANTNMNTVTSPLGHHAVIVTSPPSHHDVTVTARRTAAHSTLLTPKSSGKSSRQPTRLLFQRFVSCGSPQQRF